ncbi:LysR family transcriptional regulator [Micropruina sp.]|uniref:LysR family transcriptional regulator n=1 Tax=Micropruina sp. TaxID=2737536 RepID=UPI0039E5B642
MAEFELRQVRIFVTVADELHFRRAAERLFLPQSVVSEQVKRLERSLGVELFDRTRRSVTLAPAGARLLPLARRLLDDAAALSEAASREQATRVLRLGIGRGMGRRLPQVLKALAHDGYTVRTVETSPAERATRVSNGQLDAAFFRGRIRDTGLRAEHVWDDWIIAAMPEHHPLAARQVVTLSELAETPVALSAYDVNPALHDLLIGALAAEGKRVTPGIAFTTVEATFADLVVTPQPMWTPVYETYEAEHSYEGIRAITVEPPLTLPTFIVTAPTAPAAWHDDLADACRRVEATRA